RTPGSRGLDPLQQQLQAHPCALETIGMAVALALVPPDLVAGSIRDRDIDQANGFRFASTAGTRDAGHRDPVVGRKLPPRAFGHGYGGLRGDRAVVLDRPCRNAEL